MDVAELDATLEKEPGHFLWVHRLVPYKQPELVLEAFRELPYRLTMVGVGPLEAQLRKRLPPNVELLAWVSRDELAALFGRASGFVHVAEEDFGISTVEALAAGTPVVALDAGGARDIVRRTSTACSSSGPSIESLRAGDPRSGDTLVGPGRASRPRARVLDRAVPRADALLARRGIDRGTRDDRFAGPMKIGIDARNDGTGIGRYTFSLIRELAEIDRENEYVLFLGRERFADYAAPGPNFRPVEAAIPWFTFREQLQLPRVVARERLDLVHYPNVTFRCCHHDAVRRHDPRPELPRPELRSSATERNRQPPQARRATASSSRRPGARAG